MDVPEHLCGGTYGRRAGKRKRGGRGKEKSVLNYAERKQRRILKKFGAGGQALGADDDTKVKLEKGVPKKGKPRVAGSARGRDLRAAAALARFDTVKKNEEDDVVIKKEEEEASSSDSDTDDAFYEGSAAVDIDGKSMFDDKGRALIKICEDEDDKDGDARREMDEIQGFGRSAHEKTKIQRLPASAKVEKNTSATVNNNSSSSKPPPTSKSTTTTLPNPPNRRLPKPQIPQPTASSTSSSSCPICSLQNDPSALTCMACAHVLNKALVQSSWTCKSDICGKGTLYVNAGDAGVCGVCGVGRGKK
ncbi:wlm domain-containing [Pyrenophora seminiperda CCB06]|uniref:Wlm domain-containing n=1 Tax=Pyrenophora seminiperda CCB06 TaxID=1302712 RepID=A0A3M7M7X1_9PLEO|nr:wlm domain-containing [Pyrenophora seminiperda CCB06]